MLSKTTEWKALQDHCSAMDNVHMSALFKKKPERFQYFSKKHEGLLLDYSKNRITDETITLLLNLARACCIEEKRDRMFEGAAINTTENRAVLHTALRSPASDNIMVDGQNIMPAIHDNLERIRNCVESIQSGTWKSHTGQAIDTVVNIGIGGSDTGIKMAHEALKENNDSGISVRFVSNIDGADITETLQQCAPETTIFIVASKSFTTLETLKNAKTAKNWLAKSLGNDAVSRHFIAISNNINATRSFGISEENVFPLPDWVGGRFSLWSSIGLPLALSIGFDNFQALLNGAHSMDKHFQNAPLDENMPVILAMLAIWYRNFWHTHNAAVAPYSYNLRHFPEHIQQLDMESNGKSVNMENAPIDYDTATAIFGMQGTNAQHSFFQLLHQGTGFIPCDFIGVISPLSSYEEHHKILLANMLSQSRALMEGRENKSEPYRNFDGNRPSNTILLDKLDPFHLGMLLALYEHKIFVQGIIWNINSFDQWGVELGKAMTEDILSCASSQNLDSSTAGLMQHIDKNQALS